MKLHTERSEVERSGIASETTFRIKTTSKAFDILSSGLYTDNILAIVRELSCNAYDSHVAAGKADVPFEIHLPNINEPWFHVKDFGTGLDDDQIHNIYTTYFESTKTDSNDFIGALGLGSKSPFSYTNAFEVIARFNGVRRIYLAFINEDGLPTISNMGETPTDEPNGIEVRVTVKEKDFQTFKHRTASALKWFTIKPTIIGTPHFEFEHLPEHTLKGDGWYLLPRRWSDPRMTAVQGNIGYHVNIDYVSDNRNISHILEHGHLVAHFDIGDLEVAASREEIRYDERSKQALRERVEAYIVDIAKHIEEYVNQNQDSYWNMCLQLQDLLLNNFNTRNRSKLIEAILDVAGSKITNPNLIRFLQSHGHTSTPPSSAFMGWDLWLYKPSSYQRRLVRSDMHHRSFTPSTDIAVFENDVKTGGVARLAEYINAHKTHRRALVIRRKKDGMIPRYDNNGNHVLDKNGKKVFVPMTERDYAESYQSLLEALGHPNVGMVSTDTPQVAKRKTTQTIPVFKLGGISTRRHTSTYVWTRCNDFDITKGGLYFSLRNGSKISLNKNGKYSRINWGPTEYNENFRWICKTINEQQGTNYTTDDIVGVGASVEKKLNNKDNWVNIFDLFIECIPNYKEDIEFIKAHSATENVVGLKRLLATKKFFDLVDQLDENSVFKKTFLRWHALYDKYKDRQFQNQLELISSFDQFYGQRVFVKDDIKPIIDSTFMDHYPMLMVMDAYGVDLSRCPYYNTTKNVQDWKVVLDYIKLVDRSK